MLARNRGARISFSASLPSDVCGVWADNTMCAVLYTKDPYKELKRSILEMVREAGVCNWGEMEELIYCYIALNSSDVHRIIQDAFLSLFS
uniref:Transcription repressor n=1 Tax=Chenopodium quinoa TaxID=63459 RepID=A0A803L272_CHEQI